MEELKRRRKVLKCNLTKLENQVGGLFAREDILLEEYTVRLTRIEQLFSEFDKIQTEIEVLVDETNLELENSHREEFESKYFVIKAKLQKEIKQKQLVTNEVNQGNGNNSEMTATINTLAQNQNQLTGILSNLTGNSGHSTPHGGAPIETQSKILLPVMNIPKFNGDFKEWKSFFDLFQSIIHTNNNLSTIQKYHYLKQSLEGEAASVLKHLVITEANYETAYELLQKKYDKEDLIIEMHLETLMQCPPLKHASVDEFRKLLNVFEETLRALSALKLPTEHWNCWVNYLLVSKLDKETQQLWRRKSVALNRPSYEILFDFLDKRIFELSTLYSASSSKDSKMLSSKPNVNRNKLVHASTTLICYMCKGNHHLYNCSSYLKLNLNERQDRVSKFGLCFNCLRGKHMVKDCKSFSRCQHCSKKHHSSLHMEKSNDNVLSTSCSTNLSSLSFSAILPTAIVFVKDANQQFQTCRALLDTGSQLSLVTESCVQRLKLRRKNARLSMTGIGGISSKQTSTRGKVPIEIFTRDKNNKYSVTAYILNKVTNDLPPVNIDLNLKQWFKDRCELADPDFNLSDRIDIILGCDIVFEAILDGRLTHDVNNLMACETTFGWIITGRVLEKENLTVCHTLVDVIDIDKSLRQFWELEEPKTESKLTPAEEECENHFKQTHMRLENGQYMVKLPFKTSSFELGDSYNAALKRLLSIEKRFSKNQELSNYYKDFMREYVNLNHMEKVENSNNIPTSGYYLPHHGIWKKSSSTTKLRVVFDGSCSTTSGVSLNDLLHSGPKIHIDLIDILLRFRLGCVCYAADIKKMFRQILMAPEDRIFQMILWREASSDDIETYVLSTVTYGTSCAPYLALRVLKQLADDEKDNHPLGSMLLQNSFYVDDLIRSDDSIEEAQANIKDVIEILDKGKFSLHKWSSNSSEVLKSLPDQLYEDRNFENNEDNFVKTLGINWCSNSDELAFKVNFISLANITKRSVLATIARIFDPLGLLSPCVVVAKIFIQKLWLQKIDWDDPLSPKLQKEWSEYCRQLPLLESMHIPRWYHTYKSSQIQLHGFADASEAAYGAVIYLRVHEDDEVKITLVAAKTKVCPLKQISIARLELCAALLLTKLFKQVVSALQYDEKQLSLHAWSDSTTVLAWLNDYPRRWSTFVGNRTTKILEYLPYEKWNHIKSSENPADVASRGLNPEDFLKCDLWWKGPEFLYNDKVINQSRNMNFQTQEETRKTCLILAEQQTDDNLHILDQIIDKHSSLMTILRITAWCIRFINISLCKSKGVEHDLQNYIATDEIEAAELLYILRTQHIRFNDEIHTLKRNAELTRRCQLWNLEPFLDEKGVLRVGGRLQCASNVPFKQRHPVILHKNDHLSYLIVYFYHHKFLHASGRLLESNIRSKYWIIGVKYLIKRIVRGCTTCVRYKAESCKQKMASIPSSRFTMEKPFANTGLDYAGPITVLSWKGRGAKQIKSYIALFICMSTKALHLELVMDLSSESFIAAFKRFAARRGVVRNIFSDNGTNFQGAVRHLKEVHQYFKEKQNSEGIHRYLTEHEINWKFIPPAAPHFGGLWEAGVKRVKHHLKRITSSAHLTYDELNTLLCQIENCLNSRPLVPISDNIDDCLVLTPNHLLTGGSVMLVPETEVNESVKHYRSRWQYIQRLHNDFWKQWQKEYLSTLNQKYKWIKKQRNLKIGDVVLIMEQNLPPGKWLLGLIQEVHPGTDGLVRVVSIKTKNGIIKRPIVKLILLLDDKDVKS